MKQIYKYLYFLIFTIIFSACSDNIKNDEKNVVNLISKEQKNVNPSAIIFNNDAMAIYSKNMFNPLPKVRLEFEKALEMMDKAIELDGDYILFYANKATILIKLERYNEAIESLGKISNIDSNYVESISLQGFIYEKLGENDNAYKKYQEAIDVYNYQLTQNPKNIEIKVNKIFIKMFLEGKEFAQLDIDSLSNAHPENESIDFMKETIKYFDRKNYIQNL